LYRKTDTLIFRIAAVI